MQTFKEISTNLCNDLLAGWPKKRKLKKLPSVSILMRQWGAKIGGDVYLHADVHTIIQTKAKPNDSGTMSRSKSRSPRRASSPGSSPELNSVHMPDNDALSYLAHQLAMSTKNTGYTGPDPNRIAVPLCKQSKESSPGPVKPEPDTEEPFRFVPPLPGMQSGNLPPFVAIPGAALPGFSPTRENVLAPPPLPLAMRKRNRRESPSRNPRKPGLRPIAKKRRKRRIVKPKPLNWGPTHYTPTNDFLIGSSPYMPATAMNSRGTAVSRVMDDVGYELTKHYRSG